MADDERGGGRRGEDAGDAAQDDLDDVSMGAPIEELRTLVADPPSGFVFRLLNNLRRRDLSRQLATMSWTGMAAVFVEFLKVVFSMFEPTPRDEGGAD